MNHPAPAPNAPTTLLLGDIRTLIEGARSCAAQAVNSYLVALYWQVGDIIRRNILENQRADYGQEIVQTLSGQLTQDYGRGFSRSNLFQMIKFSELFPDMKVVHSLSERLSWSHFLSVLSLKNPLQREFYAEMCRIEQWTVRTLRAKIEGMLFERTAISKMPDLLAEKELARLRDEDRLTPALVFRDPYVLDFLELSDTYSERDLEDAILREMEKFLLEFGSDFCFNARQKRISIGKEDFHLDLLFYHRGLRRLVAIELKLGDFSAAYKGQMELYLRWLDKYERRPGEGEPLGLILCASKEEEQIELLRLNQGAVYVAEYMVELPPPEVLKEKLHAAIHVARERFAAQALPPGENGATSSLGAGEDDPSRPTPSRR